VDEEQTYEAGDRVCVQQEGGGAVPGTVIAYDGDGRYRVGVKGLGMQEVEEARLSFRDEWEGC
jgi:hypothetical protein